MKLIKRATRRSHYIRLKRKRYRDRHWYRGDLDNRLVGIAVNTPCPCSCWICKGMRKPCGELPKREIKSNDDFQNQLNEIGL